MWVRILAATAMYGILLEQDTCYCSLLLFTQEYKREPVRLDVDIAFEKNASEALR